MKTPRKLPAYITQASYGKEIGALLIDGLFAIALGVTLNLTLGKMVIAPAAGYYEARDSYYELAEKTGLYHKNETGDRLEIFTFVDKDGNTLKDEALYDNWNTLHNAVWKYYYVQAGQTGGETPFVLSGFKSDHALGTQEYSLDVGKYVYKTIYNIQVEGADKIEKPNAYFVAPTNKDGAADYTSAPVLNAETESKTKSEDKDVRLAAKKNVWQQYAGDGQQNAGLYAKACVDFVGQESAIAYERIGSKAMYLANMPAVIIPTFLFFLLIPSCMKRGKSLGKLIMKMSVVNTEGFKSKRINIILHYALIFLPLQLLLLPFNGNITFLLVMVVFLVEYIVMLLNKRHQCIHDLLSYTIVIDDRTTEAIFDDAQEEAAYARDNSDALARMIRGEEEPTTFMTGAYAQPAVLDSRTIGAARKEAATIESFDEFEAKKNAEAEPLTEATFAKDEVVEASQLSDEELLDDPEMAAMMEMDGLSKEDLLALEEQEEQTIEESKDANDDGFVDEKK